MSSRGIDGITLEQLRAGRQAFWDRDFTQLLLDSIPGETGSLVDLGCGLARAAHDVLPALPALRYTGLDLDPVRLDEARADLDRTSYARRAELVQGDLSALPFSDASFDAAIVVMALQHVARPDRALAEAMRVLRPGGRVVLIEPDNLDQRVYFAGARRELAHALSAVFARARDARLPRDLAIGPRVPGLVAAAGFVDVGFRAYACQATFQENAAAFGDRMRELARQVAGSVEGLGSEDALHQMEAALASFGDEVAPDRVEIGVHSTAVFRIVGTRPGKVGGGPTAKPSTPK